LEIEVLSWGFTLDLSGSSGCGESARVGGLDWLCLRLEVEEESNQGWSPKLKSLVSFGVGSCLLTKMSSKLRGNSQAWCLHALTV
jgi:hypothetical protein